MNKYRILTIIPTIMLLLFIACQSGDESNEAVKSAQIIAVEVAKPANADIVITRTFSGTLEGAKQSVIYATIPERVVEIPVYEGQSVKSGDVLIKLDKNGVNSRYFQAEAVFQNAKDNFEKMDRLYKQDAISEMAFKSAKTNFEVARADFVAARATVELSSPIDGIVTDITVNLGDQVPLGIPIATVAATMKMRLTIHVGVAETTRMKVGQSAKVTLEKMDSIDAKIIEISKSADPDTRLFRVELEMNNADGKLKPGMYGRAEIVVQNLDDVMSVDNTSIFREEGIAKVYVVDNDSAFVRTIEDGATDGIKTQVLSGLTSDDMVVTVGKSALRNGTPVKITGEDN